VTNAVRKNPGKGTGTTIADLIAEPGRIITLEVAAARAGRKKQTLRNWISMGKLSAENGLWYVAGKPMVDCAQRSSSRARNRV
jgi:hypothetical protein